MLLFYYFIFIRSFIQTLLLCIFNHIAEMEKHGFKSNLQFLSFINQQGNFPLRKFDSREKVNANITEQYLIITTYFQLLNEILNIIFNIENMSLTNQTKVKFREVLQSVRNQQRSCTIHFAKFSNERKAFYKHLNFSSNMMKAIQERSFYEAMIIHQQSLQQKGQQVLLMQQLRFYALYKRSHRIKQYAQYKVLLTTDMMNEIIVLLKDYDFWSDICLTKGNYLRASFILDTKKYIADKKYFFHKSLQNKKLSEEQMRQILYFFIWTTRKQQQILQQLKQNKIRTIKYIKAIQAFLLELKQIKQKQQFIHNNNQQLSIIVNKITQRLQIILQEISSVNIDHQVLTNRNDQNISLSMMEIYWKETVAEKDILFSLLTKKLAMLNGFE